MGTAFFIPPYEPFRSGGVVLIDIYLKQYYKHIFNHGKIIERHKN